AATLRRPDAAFIVGRAARRAPRQGARLPDAFERPRRVGGGGRPPRDVRARHGAVGGSHRRIYRAGRHRFVNVKARGLLRFAPGDVDQRFGDHGEGAELAVVVDAVFALLALADFRTEVPDLAGRVHLEHVQLSGRTI